MDVKNECPSIQSQYENKGKNKVVLYYYFCFIYIDLEYFYPFCYIVFGNSPKNCQQSRNLPQSPLCCKNMQITDIRF